MAKNTKDTKDITANRFHGTFQFYLALVCFVSGASGIYSIAIVMYGGLDYAFPFLNEQQYRIENTMNPPCHRQKKEEVTTSYCPEPKTLAEARAHEHALVRDYAVRRVIKNSVWLILSWLVFVGHWRVFRRVNFVSGQ